MLIFTLPFIVHTPYGALLQDCSHKGPILCAGSFRMFPIIANSVLGLQQTVSLNLVFTIEVFLRRSSVLIIECTYRLTNFTKKGNILTYKRSDVMGG
jgi:hypothetical protein